MRLSKGASVMRRLGISLAIGLLAFGLNSARAGFIVDIEPVSTDIPQGGTTKAYVFLYSDTPG